MNILGLSCYYHDAAAALIIDGKVVAGAEEERFSRIKHDSSFPQSAIAFCLEYARMTEEDIDFVVFYEKPFRKFHRIMLTTLAYYPKSYGMFREAMRVWLTKKLWIKQEIVTSLKIDASKILFCEHHLSHAGSCFYPSPFKKAAILTVDGVGEWTTTSYGVGDGNKIKLLKELHFPQSLGLLYSAYTAFLGFEVNEGEWKVMGLSPYGKPMYEDKIWKTVKLRDDGSFEIDLSYFSFQYSDNTSFSDKLIDLLGPPIEPNHSYKVTERAADIAASIQVVTEKILIHMAKYIKRVTNMTNLCIAGGVALNSVANYKILKEAGFENIYIHSAPGDSGGAIGAALYLYHHILGNKKRTLTTISYFGKSYSNEEIEDYLMKQGGKYFRYSDEKLTEIVASEIAKGKVIGWMQGRFEWGPRSLGNRSILADPRNPKMKDIINSKVKFRESFRPFAPSVLADQAYKVFDLSGGKNTSGVTGCNEVKAMAPPMVKESAHYPLYFMLYVVPVKRQWRKKVPAITHKDHTARPQLVTKEASPLYFNLITAFYKKTGVPLILNTSFNLKGEPIVSSPADAYSTFQRSGIDILVMGNYVCEK